jgi:hypothetical protein
MPDPAHAAAFPLLQLLEAGTVSEKQVPVDPEINRLLDPLRTLPPVRARCRRNHPRATICWAAIASSQALVVTAKRRRKATDPLARGGVADLIHEPVRPMEGLAWWIRDAQDPGGYITVSANPHLASGWPLRYTLHCPNATSTTHSRTV